MYIKYADITNFRCLKKAHISFQKGTNILIGPNNVGKSTVLSAIDIVLNPYITWWRRDTLTELDFYRLIKNKPIKIEILLGCGRLKCIDEKKGNLPKKQFYGITNLDNLLKWMISVVIIVIIWKILSV
jgi:predicted ATP-dependent endonuclease of OLD family